MIFSSRVMAMIWIKTMKRKGENMREKWRKGDSAL
jgi:hypothetical protein